MLKQPPDVNACHRVGMPSLGATGTKEEIKTFNAYLDDLQKKVHEAHRQLTEGETLITAETIRNKFPGKSEKPRCLIEIFKDHNKKIEVLLEREYTKGTICRYHTALRHTQDFLNGSII